MPAHRSGHTVPTSVTSARPAAFAPHVRRRGVARRPLVWLLLVGLVVVLGSIATVAVAQPNPVVPPSPTGTAQPSGTAGQASPDPCRTGAPGQPLPPQCIPQPTTSTVTAPPVTTPSAPPSPASGDCGITDVEACIADGITNFFWALVVGAL